MKKILIASLLLVAMSTQAQNVIRIEKPLKLEKVNQGTASDSILVRGEDKIVKFIPRSEFSNSTPTLQSVLEAGSSSQIFAANESNYYALNFTLVDTTIVSTSIDQYFDDGLGGSRRSVITQNNGKLRLSEELYTSESGTTTVDFTDPIAGQSATLKFPAKSEGEYTLATLEDVTFQQAYNNDSGFYSGDTEGIYTAYNFSETGFQQLDQDNYNSKFSTTFIEFSDGAGKIQRIKPSADSATTEFMLPEKPSGTYTFATLEDIAGGSQNLEQTLNNGNTAEGALIRLTDSIDGGDTKINPHKVEVTKTEYNSTLSLYAGVDEDYPSVRFSETGTHFIDIQPYEWSKNLRFFLPDATEGDHTLAITEDITLQKAADGGDSIFYEPDPGVIEAGFSIEADTENSHVGMLSSGGTDSDNYNYSEINTDNGKLLITEISTVGGVNVGRTDLEFTTPASESTILFPAPAIAGTYTLATLDDIPKVGILAPSSSTDTGIIGEIRVCNDGYIYWCVATNTWIRTAGTTF